MVSNCGVLAEGWDQPSVKCAILARPTKSTGLYLQQAGRILRPWEGQPALLLDHAGCAVEHGLPQDEREFSLDGDKDDPTRTKRKPREPRVCPSCQLVVAPTVRVCPVCTTALVTTVPLPEESAEELVEAKPGRIASSGRGAAAQARSEHVADRATFDLLRQAARQGRQVTWAQLEAVRGGTSR